MSQDGGLLHAGLAFTSFQQLFHSQVLQLVAEQGHSCENNPCEDKKHESFGIFSSKTWCELFVLSLNSTPLNAKLCPLNPRP